MTLDVLEQERRRLLAADEIRDGRSFEIRVDFGGDAFKLAEHLDLFEPGIEVAGIFGGAARWSRLGGRGLIASVRVDGHAHVHVRLPSICAGRSRTRGGSLLGPERGANVALRVTPFEGRCAAVS